MATVVPEDADEESRLQAEGTLEADLGISVRAEVRALPAASRIDAVKGASELHDLIVLGPAGLGDGSLAAAVECLGELEGCSLALVRARAGAPLDVRRNP